MPSSCLQAAQATAAAAAAAAATTTNSSTALSASEACQSLAADTLQLKKWASLIPHTSLPSSPAVFLGHTPAAAAAAAGRGAGAATRAVLAETSHGTWQYCWDLAAAA
jgi:hypothetical protein